MTSKPTQKPRYRGVSLVGLSISVLRSRIKCPPRDPCPWTPWSFVHRLLVDSTTKYTDRGSRGKSPGRVRRVLFPPDSRDGSSPSRVPSTSPSYGRTGTTYVRRGGGGPREGGRDTHRERGDGTPVEGGPDSRCESRNRGWEEDRTETRGR